jgi:hypothetical protein
MLMQLVAQIIKTKQIARYSDNCGVLLYPCGTFQVADPRRPSRTAMIQQWKVLHGSGTQVPFKHLAQVPQCLVSCKLNGVRHTGSSGGDALGLHLQVLITGVNMDGDLIAFDAMLHELATHIL